MKNVYKRDFLEADIQKSHMDQNKRIVLRCASSGGGFFSYHVEDIVEADDEPKQSTEDSEEEEHNMCWFIQSRTPGVWLLAHNWEASVFKTLYLGYFTQKPKRATDPETSEKYTLFRSKTYEKEKGYTCEFEVKYKFRGYEMTMTDQQWSLPSADESAEGELKPQRVESVKRMCKLVELPSHNGPVFDYDYDGDDDDDGDDADNDGVGSTINLVGLEQEEFSETVSLAGPLKQDFFHVHQDWHEDPLRSDKGNAEKRVAFKSSCPFDLQWGRSPPVEHMGIEPDENAPHSQQLKEPLKFWLIQGAKPNEWLLANKMERSQLDRIQAAQLSLADRVKNKKTVTQQYKITLQNKKEIIVNFVKDFEDGKIYLRKRVDDKDWRTKDGNILMGKHGVMTRLCIPRYLEFHEGAPSSEYTGLELPNMLRTKNYKSQKVRVVQEIQGEEELKAKSRTPHLDVSYFFD